MFARLRKNSVKITEKDPVFEVHYVGCTETFVASGAGCTHIPVQRIWDNSQEEKYLPRISLTINSSGVTIRHHEEKSPNEHFPIENISFCNADKAANGRIFCWISQVKVGKELKCYAILCRDPYEARGMAVLLSKHFQIAYVDWKVNRNKAIRQRRQSLLEKQLSVDSSTGSDIESESDKMTTMESQTITLDKETDKTNRDAKPESNDRQKSDAAAKMEIQNDEDLDTELGQITTMEPQHVTLDKETDGTTRAAKPYSTGSKKSTVGLKKDRDLDNGLGKLTTIESHNVTVNTETDETTRAAKPGTCDSYTYEATATVGLQKDEYLDTEIGKITTMESQNVTLDKETDRTTISAKPENSNSQKSEATPTVGLKKDGDMDTEIVKITNISESCRCIDPGIFTAKTSESEKPDSTDHKISVIAESKQDGVLVNTSIKSTPTGKLQNREYLESEMADIKTTEGDTNLKLTVSDNDKPLKLSMGGCKAVAGEHTIPSENSDDLGLNTPTNTTPVDTPNIWNRKHGTVTLTKAVGSQYDRHLESGMIENTKPSDSQNDDLHIEKVKDTPFGDSLKNENLQIKTVESKLVDSPNIEVRELQNDESAKIIELESGEGFRIGIDKNIKSVDSPTNGDLGITIDENKTPLQSESCDIENERAENSTSYDSQNMDQQTEISALMESKQSEDPGISKPMHTELPGLQNGHDLKIERTENPAPEDSHNPDLGNDTDDVFTVVKSSNTENLEMKTSGNITTVESISSVDNENNMSSNKGENLKSNDSADSGSCKSNNNDNMKIEIPEYTRLNIQAVVPEDNNDLDFDFEINESYVAGANEVEYHTQLDTDSVEIGTTTRDVNDKHVPPEDHECSVTSSEVISHASDTPDTALDDDFCSCLAQVETIAVGNFNGLNKL